MVFLFEVGRYSLIEHSFWTILTIPINKFDMKMCSLEFFETIHGVSIYDNYGYWVLNWILERKRIVKLGHYATLEECIMYNKSVLIEYDLVLLEKISKRLFPFFQVIYVLISFRSSPLKKRVFVNYDPGQKE